MFTGIIQTTGTIKKIEDQADIKVIKIHAPKIIESKKIGDSIAVDGACLTITAIEDENFNVEAIPETIKRTILKHYEHGTIVNLEKSLKCGEGIEGHLVQGHIDFIGTIIKISPKSSQNNNPDSNPNLLINTPSSTLAISFPKSMAKFFATKGSVTVNGVSLTISKLNHDTFEVSLIPQTIKTTNLCNLQVGSHVNIEVDLLSRYLDRLLQDRAQQTNYEFLVEHGFI